MSKLLFEEQLSMLFEAVFDVDYVYDMKRLFARMTREDLLGKNMRPLSRTEAANL